MKTLPLRLNPGEDLRRAVEAALASQGLQAAFVLQGIGSLADASLRLAGADTAVTLPGPSEILTLAGSVAPGASHLHASLSDAQGQVLGGHVPYGCTVRTTAEVLLALLPEWAFTREFDNTTGYAELTVARR
jgi:predicted DNA-binding protein with PD1-like motif